MDNGQVGKVWAFLSGVLIYYALDSWLVTQGGKGIFGGGILVEDRIPAAMIAVPVCSLLLLLASLVGRSYAQRIKLNDWAARIPIVGFDSLDTAKMDARLFQSSVMIAFTILPLAALFHFWRIFNSARVVSTATPSRPITSIWDWSGLTTMDDPARVCSGGTGNGECLGGATLLPGLEPWAFAVLTAAAVTASALHWAAILRRTR